MSRLKSGIVLQLFHNLHVYTKFFFTNNFSAFATNVEDDNLEHMPSVLHYFLFHSL